MYMNDKHTFITGAVVKVSTVSKTFNGVVLLFGYL